MSEGLTGKEDRLASQRLSLLVRRALPLVGQIVVHAPSSLKKLRSRQAPDWVNEPGNWGEMLHVETARAAEVVDWLCEGTDASQFTLWREMREAAPGEPLSRSAYESELSAIEEGIPTASGGGTPREESKRQVTMYTDPETGEAREGASDFEGDPEPKEPDRRQNRRKRQKTKEGDEK